MSGSSHPKGGEVDPRIGTLLAERYRIDALVGEGGMGAVYSAEHVLMRKRFAVKVLRRELTSVPEVVARFEREAMAAGNIEHPNVAAATDFGKLADGAVFLVLEFVSGHSLRDEIARGPFAVDRALHIARQIASALSAAHAQGIVHRDLKPENVMLVEKGGDPDFVKVLDFGIAKVPLGDVPSSGPKQGNPITKAGMVFGTPEYMAPEQALGQTVDGRADLYALGRDPVRDAVGRAPLQQPELGRDFGSAAVEADADVCRARAGSARAACGRANRAQALGSGRVRALRIGDRAVARDRRAARADPGPRRVSLHAWPTAPVLR